MQSLHHFPLGTLLPGSIHSVVCSLPTMRDIIGYEEKDLAITAHLTAGYPRFVTHPLIIATAEQIAKELGWQGTRPLLTPDERTARQLVRFAGEGQAVAHAGFGVVLLPDVAEVRDRARSYLQHTGAGLSSREAEDWLFQRGLLAQVEPAQLETTEPARKIQAKLHSLYGTTSPDDIYLTRGGMNAFFAAYQTVCNVQAPRDKYLWVQLGWLYLDTMRILEKFHLPGSEPVQLYNVFDLDTLEKLIAVRGHEIAGIVAEVPTNPLVQVCDLPRLRTLADRCGAALVLDPTIASPHNVNILPYCDLHINSLTKYAGSEGDVMLGALAINGHSPLADELRNEIPRRLIKPYLRDTQRLAAQIINYGSVVETINANTAKVVEFLLGHPSVREVFWAAQPQSRGNFERIVRPGGGCGAIITFTLRKPLAEFYDRARVVKGPSFGLKFTILCPFMFLAHYDLASNEAGRATMRSQGLDPDLIRLSVGTEPAEEIIAALREGLE
ncbi:MAG: PLP-dependent transferase [Verrucomicrobiota bacterium]|nr:PLP-dependent transferase [Verrucomicrobiota bacterium]